MSTTTTTPIVIIPAVELPAPSIHEAPRFTDGTGDAPALAAALTVHGVTTPLVVSDDGYHAIGPITVTVMPAGDHDELLTWEATGRVAAPNAPEGMWFRDTAHTADGMAQFVRDRLPAAEEHVRNVRDAEPVTITAPRAMARRTADALDEHAAVLRAEYLRLEHLGYRRADVLAALRTTTALARDLRAL